MTDRERLELAAKAAGVGGGFQFVRGRDTPICYRDANGRVWNPQDDDGDAFRLMIRLQLEPRYIDNSHMPGIEPSRVTMHNISGIAENSDGDPAAATRLAILKAAAKIGKEMNDATLRQGAMPWY